MSSIIPGYNYDIFISYRQKDNKHDGWVTEFVDNLKGELDATFKEEVSVYFDINPHDGLLETHDVDESLKDKLKCLIFIPIISRTYCDPKSFAWEHEFKAFVRQVSRDEFGLKVKLPNGNVASRVLPVIIHDLDIADIIECESVLGGVMRGIEFIYKESGIDKPLAVDDDEKKNLNQSKYRIQIVKVGHAVKEIVAAIKNHDQIQKQTLQQDVKTARPFMESKKTKKANKAKVITGSIIVMAMIILGLLFIPKLLNPQKELEKSIALLPFKLLSNEPDKQYLADGMMEAILLHLSQIKDLRVLGSTSVEQYRQTDKTIETIGKELNVEYILEGSFQKFGDDAKLIVQLFRTKKESHIWSNEYNRNWNDILAVQSEVAQSIANTLHAVITPEEKMIIEAKSTSDLTAYDYYLQGNEYFKRSRQEEDVRYAMQMYKKAIEVDSSFTLSWIGLAACSRFLFWFGYDLSEDNLVSARNHLDKAISLSPKLKEVRFEEASYYYQCKRDYNNALKIMESLIEEYPNDYSTISYLGYVYRRMGEFRISLEYSERAIDLNPSNWDLWWNAGTTFRFLGEYKEAEKYYQQAIDLNPSNSILYRNIANLYIHTTGQTQKAKEFLLKNEAYFDNQDYKLLIGQLAFLERDYETALQNMNSLSEDAINWQEHYFSKHLQLGLIYHAMSDDLKATEQFSIEVNQLIEKTKEAENDRRLYVSLGIAYAGLGMKEKAIEAGNKALDILNIENDAAAGTHQEIGMAKILVMVGEYDEAVNRLERTIRLNGFLTTEILKLDPFWDPVRDHEKFQEIINNPAYQVNL